MIGQYHRKKYSTLGSKKRYVTRELRLITPEEAVMLLDKNYSGNRHISGDKIQEYVRVMKNGRWCPDVPNILSFGEDGSLLDGQHRLTAVVQSGESQWFEINENVPMSAFPFFDQNKPRGAADFIPNPRRNVKAAIALRVLAMRDQGWTFSSTICHGVGKKVAIPAEVVDEYWASPEAYERYSSDGIRLYNALSRLAPTSAFGCTLWAIDVIGRAEHIDEFIEELVDGAGSVATQRLNKWVQGAVMKRERGLNADSTLTIGAFLQAYEAFRKGGDPKFLNKASNYIALYDSELKKALGYKL